MLRLGQKIYMIADSMEQRLPIGEHGYIIGYDRNTDSVFDYVVRVPKANRHYLVCAPDIETEEILLQQEADRIEKEVLLDFALATRNEALFLRLLNGDSEDGESQEAGKEVISREDFIKQVGLKAWI